MTDGNTCECCGDYGGRKNYVDELGVHRSRVLCRECASELRGVIPPSTYEPVHFCGNGGNAAVTQAEIQYQGGRFHSAEW